MGKDQRAKRLAWLCALWCVAWIPLSFLFQQNPHAPVFALLAPVVGFLSVFTTAGWSENLFQEVTLPFLVFWGGIGIMVRLTPKSKPRVGDGREETE